MARPKKPIAENRTVRREVKYTPAEAQELAKKQDGMSYSDYARKLTLGVKARVEKATSSQATLLKLRAVLSRTLVKAGAVQGAAGAALREEIRIMSELINEGLK